MVAPSQMALCLQTSYMYLNGLLSTTVKDVALVCCDSVFG